mmetsp:Transcript_11016/g.12107  ORF Transcript_11016/g.12107 Transcript_11016/m.12107 type:complete len:545 (+) Transcript_11016:62-1696(+)
MDFQRTKSGRVRKIKYPEFKRPILTDDTETRISICVQKGLNLASKDIGGKSDPYVRIMIAQKEAINSPLKRSKSVKSPKGLENTASTTVKKNTLTPSWREDFDFEIQGPLNNKIIKFECWDKDKIGKDDFMGQNQIILSEIIDAALSKYKTYSDLFDRLASPVDTISLDMLPRPGKKDRVSGSIVVVLKMEVSAYEELKAEEKKIDVENFKNRQRAQEEEHARAEQQKRDKRAKKEAELLKVIAEFQERETKVLKEKLAALTDEEKANIDISTLLPKNSPNTTALNHFIDENHGDITDALRDAIASACDKKNNKDSVLVISFVKFLKNVVKGNAKSSYASVTPEVLDKLITWNSECPGLVSMFDEYQHAGVKVSPAIKAFLDSQIWPTESGKKTFERIKKLKANPPDHDSGFTSDARALREQFQLITSFHEQHVEALKLLTEALFNWDRLVAAQVSMFAQPAGDAWAQIGLLVSDILADKGKCEGSMTDYLTSKTGYLMVSGVGQAIRHMRLVKEDKALVTSLGSKFPSSFPSSSRLAWPAHYK